MISLYRSHKRLILFKQILHSCRERNVLVLYSERCWLSTRSFHIIPEYLFLIRNILLRSALTIKRAPLPVQSKMLHTVPLSEPSASGRTINDSDCIHFDLLLVQAVKFSLITLALDTSNECYKTNKWSIHYNPSLKKTENTLFPCSLLTSSIGHLR